jgi:hypothetical protein
VSEVSAPQPIGRLGFLVASVLCFVAGLVGLGVLMHSATGGGSIAGNLFLYAPFAVIALLAAMVEEDASGAWAIAFFALFVCMLCGLYFRGFWYAEIAMTDGKWTAATLTVAFLPIKSVPVLFVAGAAALLAGKLKNGGSQAL